MKTQSILVCIAGVGLFSIAGCSLSPQAAADQPFRPPTQMCDRIGVSHVIGRYYFTDTDFLNEGCDAILDMGSRVVKLWFYNAEENPQLYYPYHSKWPQVSSLVEGAQTPYWKAVFKKPFTTYLLYHQSMGVNGYYFNQGITDQQAAEDERQTYELAKHFLTEYKGSELSQFLGDKI